MNNADDFWTEYLVSGMFNEEEDIPAVQAPAPVPDDGEALVRFAQALFRAKIIRKDRHASTKRRRRQSP